MILPLAVRETFIEHWRQDLRDLSLPGVSIELSLADTVTLGMASSWFRQNCVSPLVPGWTKQVQTELAARVATFPNGIMPRIGFCSWKGTQAAHLPSHSVRGVMYTITQDHTRVGRAIAAYINSGQPVVLHLREWLDIPPESEFRIFIKNKRIIGVSQYNWRVRFPDMATHIGHVATAIGALAEPLMDALHVDSTVADVYVYKKDEQLKATLIELNPFLPRTDACLFDWNTPAGFDGSIRFVQ